MAKGQLRVRIVGDDSDLTRKLKSAGGALTKFAAAGAAAVAAATVFSVKKFADFDQAMTNSLAIMGDVSDELRGEMSDAAREVAKTTVFSAEQAAESYFFLASAGMDAAESIEALPKVAAFAQAGNFDMALATDLLTDAQSALGLVVDDSTESLENMARVGDVLVKANTLANASVEEFSSALTEKAGAALNQLNKDVEEGVAVLAVYADQGVKGSAAGTQLNAVLEGLTRTARTNADAYDSLGVSVFDADGEMRNMADIVGDLEGALSGMSTEQQLAELSSLGLTRQARDGVVQLLGNADAIREYESELRNAAGTVDEVADKQLQTFWAQLGLLRDQLIDVALSIGERLMPYLMQMVDWLQANQPAIEAFVEQALQVIGEVITDYVVPAIATLGEWVGKLIDWWNGLSPEVQTAIKWTFGIAAALIALVPIVLKVIAVVKAVAIVIAAIASPIGIAIAAVVALGVIIWRNWDNIVNWTRNVVGRVTALRTRLVNTFTSIRDGIRDRITAMLEFVRSIPQRILQALGNLGRLLLNAGKSILRGLVNGIRSMASAPVNAVRNVVSNVRKFLPFSPAKEGPFAGRGAPEMSGRAIAIDLASGLAAESDRFARVMLDLLDVPTVDRRLQPAGTAPAGTTRRDDSRDDELLEDIRDLLEQFLRDPVSISIGDETIAASAERGDRLRNRRR